MEPRFTPNDLEIVAEQPLYDGFFCMRKISIRHRLFEGGWSRTFDRELCLRGDAVGVLLYDPVLEKFALVEQVRIGVINRPQSPWLLELVAGMLDKEGESHEAVAHREVQEEAGLEVQALEPMLAYFSSPGGSTEYFSLFCGRVNLSEVTDRIFGVGDEHENILLHVLPVDEAIGLLHAGKINNAMTIIALQWFLLHRGRLDALWGNGSLPA